MVMPPSVHPRGTYVSVGGPAITEIPAWLISLLTRSETSHAPGGIFAFGCGGDRFGSG